MGNVMKNFDCIDDYIGKENRILIDWFSFTIKLDCDLLKDYKEIYARRNFFSETFIEESTEYMMEFARNFLMLSPSVKFEHSHGTHGYADKIYYNGININYNPRSEDMGIWFEMSGKGCRAFDESAYITLKGIIERVVMLNEQKLANITRLDMAFDDFTGVFDIDTIYDKVSKHEYVSILRSFMCEYSNKGKTVYVGSQKSNVLIRFYDKAAERGLGEDLHWVRCEMQFRHDHALGYCKLLKCDSGALFQGVISRYLRFVEPSTTDTNMSRWETSPFWLDFLDSCEEKIVIYSRVRTPAELDKLVKYVEHKCMNSVDCYCKIYGIDSLLERCLQPYSTMSPRYQKLIEEMGLLENVNGDDNDDD